MKKSIQSALENTKKKESSLQPFKESERAFSLLAPSVMIGSLVTAGILGFNGLDPLVEYSNHISSTAMNIATENPWFVKNIGWAAGGFGLALMGLGLIEAKERYGFSKVLENNGVDADTLNALDAAWKNIVQTNDNVLNQVIGKHNWLSNVLESEDSVVNNVLTKSGFDPADPEQMMDLQHAYLHGLKTAFTELDVDMVKLSQNYHADDHDLTNTSIKAGMAEYFANKDSDKGQGKSFATKFKDMLSPGTSPDVLARNGLKAILTMEHLQEKSLIRIRRKEETSGLSPGM